jgi:hypothetical protein
MIETKMCAIRIDLISEDNSLTSGRIHCDCVAFFIVHFFSYLQFRYPLRSPRSERSVES